MIMISRDYKMSTESPGLLGSMACASGRAQTVPGPPGGPGARVRASGDEDREGWPGGGGGGEVKTRPRKVGERTPAQPWQGLLAHAQVGIRRNPVASRRAGL